MVALRSIPLSKAANSCAVISRRTSPPAENGMASALLPFGKVAEFLNEVLPGTAATNAVTVASGMVVAAD